MFTDAKVVNAPQQPGLEGKRLAQVPQHGATLGVSYENPQWLTASAMARFIGPQYEDDQNTLRLGSYWVFDLFLSRRVAKWAEIYAGIENLFNTTYSVGRTSDGVVSIGAPRCSSTAAFESASASRAMIRAHLLRWRPRQPAQRTREYASPAAFGRRLAAGPFSSL